MLEYLQEEGLLFQQLSTFKLSFRGLKLFLISAQGVSLFASIGLGRTRPLDKRTNHALAPLVIKDSSRN
jgi:hypothetical protein